MKAGEAKMRELSSNDNLWNTKGGKHQKKGVQCLFLGTCQTDKFATGCEQKDETFDTRLVRREMTGGDQFGKHK